MEISNFCILFTSFAFNDFDADIIIFGTWFTPIANAAPVEILRTAWCGRRATITPNCVACLFVFLKLKCEHLKELLKVYCNFMNNLQCGAFRMRILYHLHCSINRSTLATAIIICAWTLMFSASVWSSIRQSLCSRITFLYFKQQFYKTFHI